MKRVLCFILSICLVLSILPQLTKKVSAASAINYGEALQKAIYFYECQQAGPLPDWNRVPWRDDATMNDYITGGWYDAGDHVKFNLPMAYSASMLGWTLYEYSEGLEAVGQKEILEQNLQFVLDYLAECDKGTSYVYQVGDGNDDHSWWGPVELIEKEMDRPYFETDEASAVIGQSAAALAIGSIVLDNSDYLDHAKSLFELADTKRSDAGYTAASGFYNSWSGYWDELMWSAAWLYVATNDSYYLEKAESYLDYIEREEQGSAVYKYSWTQCWDDSHYGAFLLLAKLTDKDVYHEFMSNYLGWWTVGVDGNQVAYTDGGLAWASTWGSLRYATTTAFIASVYADSITDPDLIDRYETFAKAQIDYALGDNPNNRSYVVGYGVDSPEHPHHRTSHGSYADSQDIPTYHRNTLYGALVGGPSAADDDSYTDDISDYISNEVACDYNAGFVGILAKMCKEYGGSPLADFPGDVTVEDEFFVEANINSSSATYTEIKALTNNRSYYPARTIENLSFKYFMDLSEVFDAGYTAEDITVSTNYTEFPVTMSPLVQHDGTIYYVQVSFDDGTQIYPGGQSEYAGEVQLRISAPSGTTFWDPTNDYSYQELSDSLTKVQTIPVYDNGTLIYGTQPEPGENNPPVANDDASTTDEDTTVVTAILDNDTDYDGQLVASSVTVTQQPANGVVSVDSSTGDISYTPDTGFIGEDTYQYTVADNEDAVSNVATVTITVVTPGENVPPVAVDDSSTTYEDTAVTTSVLNNDSDSDGTLDQSSVAIVQTPANGGVVVDTSNGTITYTPDTGFTGTDTYSYTVMDDEGAVSNEATVTITVNEEGQVILDYTVDFDILNDWSSGFNAQLTITNTGTVAIENWILAFDFDRSIDSFWTANILENTGTYYLIGPKAWNSTIQPGESLELGFSGTPGDITEPTNVVLTADGIN